MKKENLPDNGYSSLLEKLRLEISEGLTRVQNAYDREKVITYWKIGQSIHKHFLEFKIQADYGKRIFKNLSKDLNISEPVLYQMTQFYKAYPKFEPTLNLKWTHYKILTGVKDEGKRIQLEERAALENLTIRNLELIAGDFEKGNLTAINSKKTNTGVTVSTPPILRVLKGKLYTYSLFKPKFSDKYFIDLGFYISQESEFTEAKSEFIESTKTGGSYDLKFIEAAKKDVYVYKAYILEIVDGDTMWVNIDLGFKTWIYHKIRFRGIMTPEKETKEGQTSKLYVETVLKGIQFVVIKSHGRDKYDRFLMDVFYKAGEEDAQKVYAEGNFLNQELLNKKLAVLYTE